MYTWWQRLRSFRHHAHYALSERLRWSRGAHHEAPALELPEVDAAQAERIARLQSRYQAGFVPRKPAWQRDSASQQD
jgi:hypothetical protein